MPTTAQVFVLNGSPTSGKNTFVEMMPYETVHYSYVDFTREILRNAGIPVETKTNDMRVLLESVNNAIEIYNDIPFKDCCDVIMDFLDGRYENCELLFIDVRKPENIDRFFRLFKGIRTVYVSNKKPISSVTESDSQVANYEYDFYIDNSGSLEDLQREADRFIAEIRGDNS